jgi:Yip1 domain
MANVDPLDEMNPYAAPEADLCREDVGRSKTRGIDLSVENPFLTIWTRPRATIRGILNTNPTYLVLPLAMAGGVTQTLDSAAQTNAGDQLPLARILIMGTLLGMMCGLIGIYIGGALLSWAGRRLGGHGSSEELRAAIAWSQVPALARIPIWILQIDLIGREMFTSKKPVLHGSPGLGLVLIITGVIGIILGIWAFFTMLKCIGEAHGFSAWRAWGLLILTVGIPILLILVLLDMASR